MSTLSKALLYLACVPLGWIVVFVVHVVLLRRSGPCPGPCDAPAMALAFELLLVGPVVGIAIA